MSQREQQTARINVDDATWQAFRIRAIQANRSVADELAPSSGTTSAAPGQSTPRVHRVAGRPR
jgi:plasmid stability protein